MRNFPESRFERNIEGLVNESLKEVHDKTSSHISQYDLYEKVIKYISLEAKSNKTEADDEQIFLKLEDEKRLHELALFWLDFTQRYIDNNGSNNVSLKLFDYEDIYKSLFSEYDFESSLNLSVNQINKNVKEGMMKDHPYLFSREPEYSNIGDPIYIEESRNIDYLMDGGVINIEESNIDVNDAKINKQNYAKTKANKIPPEKKRKILRDETSSDNSRTKSTKQISSESEGQSEKVNYNKAKRVRNKYPNGKRGNNKRERSISDSGRKSVYNVSFPSKNKVKAFWKNHEFTGKRKNVGK